MVVRMKLIYPMMMKIPVLRLGGGVNFTVPSPEILWRNQNGRLQLAYSINKFPSVMAMAT